MKAALFYGPTNNALTTVYLLNAVNTVKVTGGVSGGASPTIGVQGPDTNISLFIAAKGTNSVVVSSNLSASANLTVSGNMLVNTAGKGVSIKSGANCKCGTTVLNAGAAVVANTSVTANSVILLSNVSPSGAVGAPFISSVTPGVGFNITSTNLGDNSTVGYVIVEQG